MALSWYGWIPLIAPKLVHKSYIQRLLDQSMGRSSKILNVGTNDYVIRADLPSVVNVDWLHEFSPAYRLAVRKVLGFAPDDLVFFSLRDFSDQRKISLSDYKRYAFAVNNHGKVTKTVILMRDTQAQVPLEIDTATLDDIHADSVAQFHDIDDQGLVCYMPQLCRPSTAGNDAITLISRYHFELVRGVYHEHVFHHEGDFLLQPMQANGREEALSLICGQYASMAVNSHTGIKRWVRYFSGKAWLHGREIALGNHFALHARGNMVWCAHFHKLFEENGHGSCIATGEPFAEALRSMTLLHDELTVLGNAKAFTPVQRVLIWLSLGALFLSTLTAQNSLSCFRELGLLCRIAIAILFPLAWYLVFWLSLTRSQRRVATMSHEEH